MDVALHGHLRPLAFVGRAVQTPISRNIDTIAHQLGAKTAAGDAETLVSLGPVTVVFVTRLAFVVYNDVSSQPSRGRGRIPKLTLEYLDPYIGVRGIVELRRLVNRGVERVVAVVTRDVGEVADIGLRSGLTKQGRDGQEITGYMSHRYQYVRQWGCYSV